MMVSALLAITSLFASGTCFPMEQQLVFANEISTPSLEEIWGEEWPFNGIPAFAHLNHTKCLLNRDVEFDIGIIGVPFDTATTYRSGARFGPRAIRTASQRQTSLRGFNTRAGINPYKNWASLLDCGDIPITPMDNTVALKQMSLAFEELLLNHKSTDQFHAPRLIALGGDHSITLPHLRSLKQLYGKIAVIHFDAHLDTWSPKGYPSYWNSNQSEFTHGSMLWMAKNEDLISDDSNVHIGIRTRISGTDWTDFEEDTKQGWKRYSADDVWLEGRESLDKIIAEVKKRIGNNMPAFISLDVDCMDPAFTPGTGTIEPGGMLPREVIYLLRRFDLNLVGADVVEVAPSFDHAEVTSTNAAQIAYELLTSMVQKGKPFLPEK